MNVRWRFDKYIRKIHDEILTVVRFIVLSFMIQYDLVNSNSSDTSDISHSSNTAKCD